jgi:hypothetical protein
MNRYNAVLGMPWLQEQNPVIDWTTRTVSINNRILQTKLGQYEELTSMQEGSEKNLSAAGLGPDTSSGEEGAQKVTQTPKQQTNRTRQERPNQNKTIQQKPKEKYERKLKEVLKKLPEKYHKFIKLFIKKEYQLPRHDKQFEVKINLKPGFKPPSVKQFHKSPAELKIKDKFIEEFSEAGYIQPGNRKTLARDMFIPKKDRTKQMIINYQALNNRTIKDANKTLHQEQK